MAVIFFIHGIAYAAGTGNEFINGPDFFVESGVILVTLDYRLGALGFLSLNLPEYSGNMGLKDQQLALKWTHENIEYFGGDNARVTILGDSSGTAFINFQIIIFRRPMPCNGENALITVYIIYFQFQYVQIDFRCIQCTFAIIIGRIS